MAKEYYLYVKGKAVPVSEEVYKAYWKITEHEKYLQRKDWKHNVISFSALDHDGHFVDNIIDEKSLRKNCRSKTKQKRYDQINLRGGVTKSYTLRYKKQDFRKAEVQNSENRKSRISIIENLANIKADRIYY